MVTDSTPAPFTRNVWHKFKLFRDFEEQLFEDRRKNHAVGDKLRVGGERWTKVRNEEVYPTWYYCEHLEMSAQTEYRICKEGTAADIEIRSSPKDCHRIQITTAGPIWPDGSINWGVDHKLEMEQLNIHGESSGWGPFHRQADGTIINRDKAISSAERDPAYLCGLLKALNNKNNHQQHDCELIVFAKAYDEAMSLETFLTIVKTATRRTRLNNFCSISVLSASKGYFLKYTFNHIG